MFDWLARKTSKGLARYLRKPGRNYRIFVVTDTAKLAGVLQPGDMLLICGLSHISTGIKYLTQSTWSPAAKYVDNNHNTIETSPEDATLIHHIRHHSLFAPRDFDLSPYFSIFKPTQKAGFDHHLVKGAETRQITG